VLKNTLFFTQESLSDRISSCLRLWIVLNFEFKFRTAKSTYVEKSADECAWFACWKSLVWIPQLVKWPTLPWSYNIIQNTTPRCTLLSSLHTTTTIHVLILKPELQKSHLLHVRSKSCRILYSEVNFHSNSYSDRKSESMRGAGRKLRTEGTQIT
jgi:hypothetical protein